VDAILVLPDKKELEGGAREKTIKSCWILKKIYQNEKNKYSVSVSGGIYSQ
jgi:hypothetical protein